MELALFGISHVAEETQHVCGVVEAAIAKATSARSRMERSVASLAVRAKANTVQMVGALSKRVQEVVPHTEE